MSKREALAVLVAVTGGLLCTTLMTAPVGIALVAAGLYLLALPRLSATWRGAGRSRGSGWR